MNNGAGVPLSAYPLSLRSICAQPRGTTRNMPSLSAKPVWSNTVVEIDLLPDPTGTLVRLTHRDLPTPARTRGSFSEPARTR